MKEIKHLNDATIELTENELKEIEELSVETLEELSNGKDGE